MTREIADRLLESLRPTRHLLTRTLADISIGGPEYRQIDRVVQEIDGLAEILIGDMTHYHQKGHSVQTPNTGNGSEETFPDLRMLPTFNSGREEITSSVIREVPLPG